MMYFIDHPIFVYSFSSAVINYFLYISFYRSTFVLIYIILLSMLKIKRLFMVPGPNVLHKYLIFRCAAARCVDTEYRVIVNDLLSGLRIHLTDRKGRCLKGITLIYIRVSCKVSIRASGYLTLLSPSPPSAAVIFIIASSFDSPLCPTE